MSYCGNTSRILGVYMSSEAKQLALAHPNKPWARRYLRQQFTSFLPPAKVEAVKAKQQRKFVRGAQVTAPIKPGVT